MRSCARPSSSARRALPSADSATALRVTCCAGQRVGARGVFVHQARQQVRIQTSPVHTDAHRLVITAGGFDHFRELRIGACCRGDVARVDAVLGERGSAVRMLAQQLVAV